MDTGQYLPQQKFDEKTSAFLPYEHKENPYLALEGRIKKEAVTKFIEARRALKSNELELSAQLFEEVSVIAPGLSGPWVMRGDIALKSQDKALAVEHFKKAISVNVKNINAYLKLAKTQRQLGNFIDAQNTYANALSVWPDFPEAHLNLGILYDIYLNHPLRAQKHMEAYVFLTEDENTQVSLWLREIQKRTGVAPSLIQQKGADSSISVN
ncbi:MAG: tetratricopeptide repeat protein [Agarilytica sp.]